MYETFFGLRELPFELTANPRYLFLTTRQREALSVLQYGLLSSKSLTLLVGEAGTGKTTLLKAALDSDRCSKVRCVYLNNPTLTPADFVMILARKFDLGTDAASAKPVLLNRLEAKLRQVRAQGEITALVVDEAQSLSTELLEEVRLLANIETPSEKLLPLVLAGQPELADRLEQTELRQLKQRVALRCELVPFELGDTAAYIASRIITAGGSPVGLFTQEAVRLVHEHAHGIPRTINVICDNALVSGMAIGRRLVDRALVEEVCRDLHLTPVSRQGAEEPTAVAPTPPPSDDVLQDVEGGGDRVQEPASADTPATASRFGFRFRWRTAPAVRTSARIITE